MKRLISILLVAALVACTFAFPSSAANAPKETIVPNGNPFITSIFTADPSAHVWSSNPNKLYVYPSRDQDPAQGCDLMDKYHVYSTEDMVNWVDEGEIIRSEEVAWGRPEGGFMWAPDAAYANNTYYFYYPHPASSDWGSSWRVGVATSKYPDRGFVDQGFIIGGTDGPGLGTVGEGMIDPQVFIDSDGTPYLFIGGSQRCFYAKMNKDMVSLAEPLKCLTANNSSDRNKDAFKDVYNALPSYHEGPWVFKRGNLYYMTYPGGNTTVDGKKSDRMIYCTSSSINGPWEYKGFFHNPVNTGDTSHGSVVEFKGRWFLFYHNAEVYSTNAGNTTGNLRSICVDELFFNEDGTIKMVEQTKTGPSAIEGVTYTAPAQYDYPATAAVLAGGASLADSDVWGKSITGLTSATRTATFNNVNGGLGGRGTIKIRAAATARRTVKIVVNGVDWGYVNLMPTGDITDFTKEAAFTVTNLKPGETNTVQLVGRSSGAFNVSQMSVVPFNDYDIMNPVGQAKITSISATTPLANGYAANVQYNIEGENLTGKYLDLYFLGKAPVRIKASSNSVSGIYRVDADSIIGLKLAGEASYNFSAKVVGEKSLANASVKIMPTKDLWTVWSANDNGKLRLKFGGDITSSKTITFFTGGTEYPVTGRDASSVLVDINFSALTPRQEALGGKEEIPGTTIVIKGIKYPMFPSFSFTFTTEVRLAPEIKFYNANLATLGGAATRNNNGGVLENGVRTGVIENLSNANSWAEWKIPAEDVVKSGDYVFAVYYGTNDSSPSCNVIVNGATLSGKLVMPGTGGWGNFTGYAEKVVTLVAGQDNTIRLSIGTSSGQGFNIYKVSAQRIPG